MSDTSPPASRRILVVDDNAINRRLAMAFVKRLGFVTEEVEDGASALAKLASSPFDVVFLDISMPGMSGEEVLARLRADPSFSGLHIIAYTAHALPEEKQRLSMPASTTC
jgi:CheY-like chemotaxis protein